MAPALMLQAGVVLARLNGTARLNSGVSFLELGRWREGVRREAVERQGWKAMRWRRIFAWRTEKGITFIIYPLLLNSVMFPAFPRNGHFPDWQYWCCRQECQTKLLLKMEVMRAGGLLESNP